MRYPNGSQSRPPVTSSFGPRNATGGASSYHRGTDMVGFDQVRAVADGRVVAVGTPGGWSAGGRQVWIQHDGYFTRSLHLGSAAVSVGQQVREGDFIGTMDTTGTAQGKHLHFELTPGNWHASNSGQVDPMPYIAARLSAAGPVATDATRALQTDLVMLGYELVIDGIYGPATEGAVRDFQSKNGLEVDGDAGPLTQAKIDERLNAPVGGNRTSRPTVDVQKLVGANPDGVYGPDTTAKVKAWQSSHGLEADGIWGPKSDAVGFPVPVQASKLNEDGIWGEAVTSALQTVLHVMPVDGIRGEDTVRAIQLAVGMTGDDVDGIWGPNTARHLQAAIGLTGDDVDGDFGPKSTLRLQQYLNGGGTFAAGTIPTPAPKPADEPVTSRIPTYPRAARAWNVPLGDGLRPGGVVITQLVAHHTAGTSDDEGYFKTRNSRQSCPTWYGKVENGAPVVAEMMLPGRRPSATPGRNDDTVAIELQNSAVGEPWPVDDRLLEELAQLLAWLSTQTELNGVPCRFDLSRDDVLVGDGQVSTRATECPGRYVRDRLANVRARARVIAAGATPTPDTGAQPSPKPDVFVQVSQLAIEDAGAALHQLQRKLDAIGVRA